MLKELIKKIEAWRDQAKENPYSGLKESVAYERVLRELEELCEAEPEQHYEYFVSFTGLIRGCDYFANGSITMTHQIQNKEDIQYIEQEIEKSTALRDVILINFALLR